VELSGLDCVLGIIEAIYNDTIIQNKRSISKLDCVLNTMKERPAAKGWPTTHMVYIKQCVFPPTSTFLASLHFYHVRDPYGIILLYLLSQEHHYRYP
jgi:hypothetical protein